jgi:hypothetical protein
LATAAAAWWSVAPRNLGTLQVGVPADVSVLELMPGPVPLLTPATTLAWAKRI